MKKLAVFTCLAFLLFTITSSAQVRPVEDTKDKEETSKSSDKNKEEKEIEVKTASYKNLPDSFKVKYMGGLFGFSKNRKGSIKFDDINERLVFFGKDGKEKFSIPYGSFLVIYPSYKKVQAGSGRVIGAAPVPGSSILGSLVKKTKNYMIIKFKDPDVDAEGNINFLLDNGEMLSNAIHSLGRRAEMKQRGDSYLRGKEY